MSVNSRTGIRPKRIFGAITVFLLLGGSGLGVLGVAAADDGQVATITLPSRMGGDRGIYHYSDDNIEGTMQFQWSDAFAWKDQFGHWRSVQLLESRATDDMDDEASQAMYRNSIHTIIDAELNQNIAAANGFSASWASGGGEVYVERTNRMQFGWDDLPCGWVNNAQGSVVEEIVLEGCDGQYILRDVAIEQWNGGEVLVGIAGGRGDLYELKFSANLPYPVVVEKLGDRGFRMEITHFEAGNGNAKPIELPGPTELSPIGTSPADRMGPTENIPVKYSLDAAFEDARAMVEDEGFKQFLAENPDWYVADADYFYQAKGDHEDYGWIFILQGETTQFFVFIANSEGQQIRGLPGLPVPLPVDPNRQSGLMYSAFLIENRTGIPLADLPERMWSPIDIAENWAIYAGQPVANATHYGFDRTWCSKPNCDQGTVYAGQATSAAVAIAGNGPMLDLVGEEDVTIGNFTALVYDSSDQPVAVLERQVFREVSRPGAATIASSESAPVTQDSSVPLLAAFRWDMPGSAVVAGAGILASLGAAAYFFWPLLKSVPGLALFSRVREDQLLQHPVRATIMQTIESSPGIHYQDLVRGSKLGNGQVEHHVEKLIRAGLVSKQATSGYTCFFVRGAMDHDVMAATAAVKAEGARNILGIIEQQPGVNAKAVGASSGLAPATVHHHIKRLQSVGLIDAKRGARGALALYVTPLASRLRAQHAAA